MCLRAVRSAWAALVACACDEVCLRRGPAPVRMPQGESVRLNINERYTTDPSPGDRPVRARNARLMGGAIVLALAAVVAVVTLTAQAGQRTELAEDVAKRLGYSLARKPRQFTMLEGEPVVAPVPAISAVAGAHAASRGAAGEANALEGQISDLKKEIQAIANTKELEAKLQAKIAQDRRNDEADVAHELALQKTLAELKLLAKEKFDQINMDKEKEGGLTAEEAAQLDQQILALENSLKVLSPPLVDLTFTSFTLIGTRRSLARHLSCAQSSSLACPLHTRTLHSLHACALAHGGASGTDVCACGHACVYPPTRPHGAARTHACVNVHGSCPSCVCMCMGIQISFCGGRMRVHLYRTVQHLACLVIAVYVVHDVNKT